MSRIGKKIITVEPGIEASINGSTFAVKGPLGSLTRDFDPRVSIVLTDGKIKVEPVKGNPETKAMWGTVSAHISNMLSGVKKPFQKKLIIEGIGFKSEVKGGDLVLNLGFSHQVKVAIPKDLKVTAEKNNLTIAGPDIESVGRFAANVRDLKKPEPYKGKGIRYDNEVIRRKQGKKTA